MNTVALDKVTSNDGTPITYDRSGTGPPLVLVAGTGGAGPAAWTVFPMLQERFTVYAVDRRGHGQSGDSPTYALEREFEDIAAVVDSIGEPAYLLGHSFGGICALEAALLSRNLRKLVIYEGFILPHLVKSLIPEGLINQLEGLLNKGDREGLLTLFYRENVGMSPEELEQFKSSPAWSERLAATQTLPRELRAVDQYRFEPQRFESLKTPTLLLVGGDSPDFVFESTKFLAGAMPNSQIVELPGQQHIAMYTAPGLFLQSVLGFLNEAS